MPKQSYKYLTNQNPIASPSQKINLADVDHLYQPRFELSLMQRAVFHNLTLATRLASKNRPTRRRTRIRDIDLSKHRIFPPRVCREEANLSLLDAEWQQHRSVKIVIRLHDEPCEKPRRERLGRENSTVVRSYRNGASSLLICTSLQ